MKGKAFIPLVLGLVVGLFAVKLVVDTVRRSQAGQVKATITVVRARTDIGAFRKIAQDMVEEIEITDESLAPKNQRLGGAKEVVGRVTAKAIPTGAIVLGNMLSPKGTKPGMVARIPAGYRAVSVKIGEVTSAGYQIQPGDWVDVMVVMDVRSGGRKKETIAEVLLYKIRVAAIGRGTDEEASGSGRNAKAAKSATLLVEEADAPKLHLAATRGRIALALRGSEENRADQAARGTSPELLAALGLSDEEADLQPVAGAMLAADRPVRRATPFDVTVFRGSRRGESVERITFESKESSNVIGVTRGVGKAPASLDRRVRSSLPRRPAPPEREPTQPNNDANANEDQDFEGPPE